MRVFRSFFRFKEYFGHFLNLGGILVNFRFWEVFMLFFRFMGYFGKFLVSGGLYVIFLDLGGIFNFQVSGRYLCHFLRFWGGIFVIFKF